MVTVPRNSERSPVGTNTSVREYFQAVWNDGELEPFDTDIVSDGYATHHQPDVDYVGEELREAEAA
jgi:hypothetical protein